MRKDFFVGILASALAAAAVPSPGAAAVTVNIGEVGSDVVATASGTLDLTGLISAGTFALSPGVRGTPGYIGLGTSGNVAGYSGLTGPANFGPGTNLVGGTSNTGTSFSLNGLYNTTPLVFLPFGFLSGSSVLSGSETFAGQTFASLGLAPGQYVFSSQNDHVTINIGDQVAAVPESATWAMMLLGFAGIGASMRRRRRATSSNLRTA